MDEKILNKIEKLNPWFYEVDILGHLTTPGIKSSWDSISLRNRASYREKLLVDEFLQRYDVKEKSILDVGCNCGYWGSKYIKRGASSYLGLDGRIQFVMQGELYWSYNKFAEHSYSFRFLTMDVTCRDAWKVVEAKAEEKGLFDLTLCAGILYHVKDYQRLLRYISGVTKEVILIDTRVASEEKEETEPGDLCFNAIPGSLEKTVPSMNNLDITMKALGWRGERLSVKDKVPKGLYGKDDYSKGNRVTILYRRDIDGCE